MWFVVLNKITGSIKMYLQNPVIFLSLNSFSPPAGNAIGKDYRLLAPQ